jgi:hypothetical protein
MMAMRVLNWPNSLAGAKSSSVLAVEATIQSSAANMGKGYNLVYAAEFIAYQAAFLAIIARPKVVFAQVKS